LGTQPAIQAHLIVHVDPMVRQGTAECEDADLTQCGSLSFEPWVRRTQNLSWLAETWVNAGRTVDMQLGPDASLAWAGHPESLDSLGPDAEETAEKGRCALRHLVESGSASLGLHMHGVMPDDSGLIGEIRTPEFVDPCSVTRGDPLVDEDAALVEALVHYGASSVHPLASMLGAPIESFTAHTPRSMATKIAVLDDPDGIDEQVTRDFPDTFQPYTLSTAYSECLQQQIDHLPMEAYPADPVMPLVAGQGPPIIPGNRVVGSMAPHLGHPQDGSVEAARRRLVQLLLNWRVAGLRGEADRPWVFAFHTHLFDLGGGAPDPWETADRQLDAARGQSFRGDLEGIARSVDQLASRSSWQGVGGADGVMTWSLPRDVSVAGSRFGVGLEVEGPYLPLVTERLAQGHLKCAVSDGDFDLFVVERCPGGWAWGGDAMGQHCADMRPIETVTVVVSGVGDCYEAPVDGLVAGDVDGERMMQPRLCPGGVEVPSAGLIVERRDGDPWIDGLCRSGLAPLFPG